MEGHMRICLPVAVLLLLAVLRSAESIAVYRQQVKGRLVCSNGFGGNGSIPYANAKGNLTCVLTASYVDASGGGRIATIRTRTPIASDYKGFFTQTLTFTDRRASAQPSSPILYLLCNATYGNNRVRKTVTDTGPGIVDLGNVVFCRRFYKPVIGGFSCASSVPPRPIINFRATISCTLNITFFTSGRAGPQQKLALPITIAVTSNTTGGFSSRFSRTLPKGVFMDTVITDARVVCRVAGPGGTVIPNTSRTAYALGNKVVNFNVIPVLDNTQRFCS